MNDADGIRQGRPHGGLGILWRKSLGSICTVTTIEPRLQMLQLSVGQQHIKFLNVYLPFDNGSNILDFQMYLAQINSYLDNRYSAAFGDFNGNIRGNHRFGIELTHFCENNSLIIYV